MQDHRLNDEGKPRGDLIRLVEFAQLRSAGGVVRTPDKRKRNRRKAAKLARRRNR